MSDTLLIQANDASSALAQANFIIPVVNNVLITTALLPNAIQGVPYSTLIGVAGGIPAYTGLVIGNTGANSWSFSGATLIGTPATVETATLTLLMGDSMGVPAATQLNLTVLPASGGTLTVIANGGQPVPAAVRGVSYELILTCTNPTGAVTWLKLSGAAWGGVSTPAGLPANSCLFSGTPTSSPQTDIFVIQATDGASNTGTITI